MSIRIVFNGREYGSVEEMPPDVRREYEAVIGIFADKDRDGVPDIMQGTMGLRGDTDRDGTPDAVPGMTTVTSTSTSIVHDGKTYSRVEDLPPAARAQYEQAMGMLARTPVAEPEMARPASSAPERPPFPSRPDRVEPFASPITEEPSAARYLIPLLIVIAVAVVLVVLVLRS